ncbi:putative EF-hand domain-containing protein [Helianthus debilis subsp. tardiflorus]
MKTSAPWCFACVEMAVNTDKFELYFKRADVDQDGRVSGSEAVSFFQASGLSKPVLAQDHVVGGLISVRFRSDLLCYRLGCVC